MQRGDLLFLVGACLLLPASGFSQTNGSVSFVQGSSIQIPASPSIDGILDAITLEAWVRLEGTTNHPTAIRRALAPGPDAETVFGLGLPGGVSGPGFVPLGFWLRVGPAPAGPFTSHLLLTQVVNQAPDWHHLAGTFDGSTMRLFWDGAELVSASHPGVIASSTLPVLLGGGIGNSSWVGRIDEVRLWNVARSAAEVTDFRLAPLLGSESGLVGYWRLDEGGGQSAADSSSNGNGGFLGLLPIPDPADPGWSSTSPPIGPVVESVSPPFGPFYGSTPITVAGQGFTPGGSVLSIAGQPLLGAIVVDPKTILAVVPPGVAGAAEVAVSSYYEPGTLPGGWSWADHLHATGGVSAASGGAVDLSLFGEPANGVHLYLVATSISGTSPGLPLPGTSLLLPLNPDVWTTIGLQEANSPTFASFFGVLDGEGRGSAAFDPGPTPLTPSAVGIPLHFAYVVFDSYAGGFSLASNAATVSISP